MLGPVMAGPTPSSCTPTPAVVSIFMLLAVSNSSVKFAEWASGDLLDTINFTSIHANSVQYHQIRVTDPINFGERNHQAEDVIVYYATRAVRAISPFNTLLSSFIPLFHLRVPI